MYSKICGDRTLQKVFLVTNMWATVPCEVGEAFEKRLSEIAFKLALGKGAHMVRYDGTLQSAHDIIRKLTKNYLAPLPIQWEVVKHKDTIDTTTGEAINRELDEQTGRHRDELGRAEEGVRVLRERDEMREEEMRKQLGEGGRMVQGWMDGMKKRLEGRMEEMEREAKKERERTEAELTDLRRRLQDATSASAADRARLERAEVEHKRQLADLTRRLQNEVSASLAYRVALEQDVKELQDRVATVNTMPTLYVQVLLCPPTHDG